MNIEVEMKYSPPKSLESSPIQVGEGEMFTNPPNDSFDFSVDIDQSEFENVDEESPNNLK